MRPIPNQIARRLPRPREFERSDVTWDPDTETLLLADDEGDPAEMI
jgi:hypothetical protein